MSHEFCRGRLKMARVDGKEAGVKIPVISSSEMFLDNYAIFLGDVWYQEYDACCVFEARASAIYDYIDEQVGKSDDERTIKRIW